MKNLLVTFELSNEEKDFFQKELGPFVQIAYLKDSPDRKESLQKAELLFCWQPQAEIKEEEYSLLKNAEIMQLLSAGADHVPFTKIPENIKIAGNIGAFAEPMAEHTLAMVLSLLKRLFIEHQKMQRGIFDQFSENRMLKGLTCGILGFGGIGKAVARLVRPFGVKIMAVNTSGKTEENVEFIGTLQDLDYILQNSDILIISIPLSKKTTGIIGKKELEMMKENALLVNVSRGEIIKEEAFYLHLKEHPQFMAGIDAWWVEPFRHGKFEMHYPFLDLPNVIGSPHNSGVTKDSVFEAAKTAIRNIKNYLEGKEPKGVVKREDYL